MNWLRRLLGLHVHQWGAEEVITILPGQFRLIRNPTVVMQFMGRTLRVRWCSCGNYKKVRRAPKPDRFLVDRAGVAYPPITEIRLKGKGGKR